MWLVFNQQNCKLSLIYKTALFFTLENPVVLLIWVLSLEGKCGKLLTLSMFERKN